MLFLNNCLDLATGKVSKNVANCKYYKVKTKLVISIKSQLIYFIRNYPFISKEILLKLKISFTQILGTSTVVWYMKMCKNGLYRIVRAE